jgi:2-polyprenyl-6-methoxyphenol hydroxylase-like FAD-dependent oxidoreductase
MRVLIVGGGIAGPALALFLHRAGIQSSVFEAYPEQTGLGGGLALAPNGMRVLDSLGLADQLGDRASHIAEYWFRNDRGVTLARFANASAERYGQPMVGLARATLAELVSDALRRAGVRLAYHKRLSGIDQDAAGVTAYFADGSSARGDLLIGADGVRSATRRLVLPNAVEPSYRLHRRGRFRARAPVAVAVRTRPAGHDVHVRGARFLRVERRRQWADDVVVEPAAPQAAHA